MKKKLISILLTSVMTVGLLSACGSAHTDDNTKNSKTNTTETVSDISRTDSDSAPVSVTLNEVAHSIFYAPMYAAIENGYFDEEGIDLTLVTGFGADKTMTAVISGEADIGFMGSESSIYTYDEGANDYVTKPFNPLELVARVKSQLRRYTQLGSTIDKSNQAVYAVGGLSIDDEQKEVTVDGEPVRLTPIEYNILLLLVKNQGKVFSIDQIYESIWNEEALGADNTVAVHIRHIREKIEINPKDPQYLKVVWGVGYKIEKIEPR